MMNDKPSFEEAFTKFEGLCSYEAHRYWHAFHQIHDLDDLVQEGYIGLWRAYETCANWTTFPAYAHRLISHGIYRYCHDHNHLIRVPHTTKQSGKEYVPHLVVPLEITIGDEGDEHDLPAPDRDADTEITVHDTLAQMPEQQARNLWAVCAEGWEQKAHAARVGQHPVTIQKSVTRAKERFRKLWEGAPLSKSDRNGCAMHLTKEVC